MAFNPSSPVTGGAQTGLTSPTYTLTVDVAPDATGKQWAVTALGGTQTSVTTHSASSPFTITGFRPKNFKALGMPDSNGLYRVGKNRWRFIIRKGVTPAANQPAALMQVTLDCEIPAGADTYDAANVRAALSLAFGAVWAQSSGIGDSGVTGIL